MFVLLMTRQPSDRSVAAFAKAYFVPLTSGNVGQLRQYIYWTRMWRLGGVVAIGAVAIIAALIADKTFGNPWVLVIAGYAIGTLLAELLRPVERRDGPRVASLNRRRVQDFVAPQFVVVVVVVFVASLVPVVYLWASSPVRSWVDSADPARDAHNRPQDWFLYALAGVLVVVALVAVLGVRSLARAPFPSDTSDRQAVRHAMRSVSIMSVIGGAVMVFGAIGAHLGGAATMLDGNAPKLFQWMNVFVAFVCALSAVWGGLLTLSTIPRLAPFAGELPMVPDAKRPPEH